MALAVVYSRASAGVRAPLVTVEVHISYGMAGFYIVGLPEKGVRESKDRVRSAFLNSHLTFPDRRITVNLAPADLPKEGGRFDLPIALGILAASGQLAIDELNQYEFLGELALSGELRPLPAVLPDVLGAHESQRKLIVPANNAAEAALVSQVNVLSATSLLDVCAHFKGEKSLPVCTRDNVQAQKVDAADLSDVKGQRQAKRALEIAAAGGHSLLFVGPPGTGKTMLASRLPGILPDMTEAEALEAAAIASVSQQGFDVASWRKIPFRAPHHGSSSVALVGGGRPPQPGEISLAHNGVLFLDELPEFSRHVLDSLREPLESGYVTISRVATQRVYPSRFQLIAAMNPCPCGYAGSTMDYCQCTSEQIRRYMGKISGPLLDRIDMHVEVPRCSPDRLRTNSPEEKSEVVRQRVIAAREFQLRRQHKLNHQLTVPELEEVMHLGKQARAMLEQVVTKFNLSARVYHRIIKVARTIADIGQNGTISEAHISETLACRALDRVKN